MAGRLTGSRTKVLRALNDVGRDDTDATGIPANRLGFSSYGDTEQSDLDERQEWQIVQSCMTLDDFLPRFTSSAPG